MCSNWKSIHVQVTHLHALCSLLKMRLFLSFFMGFPAHTHTHEIITKIYNINTDTHLMTAVAMVRLECV